MGRQTVRVSILAASLIAAKVVATGAATSSPRRGELNLPDGLRAQ